MPKVYIKTFGCQMNVRDSEALLGLFIEKGYEFVQKPEDADIILVNTCSVREHAEQRAVSFLGRLNKKGAVSVRGQFPIVGLIGCMARNRGEELFKKNPHINLVVGPAEFDKIPEYVDKIIVDRGRGKKRIIDLEDHLRNDYFYYASFRKNSDCAQVVISTGCSNHCSYCIVPYVRGELALRSPDDILDEVKRNVKLGIKKITLLGQNVNDYCYKSPAISHQPAITFVDLLRMVESVEGVKEIDFITSNPRNTSRELFELMAESKKIKKHLHLPFQSGSDRILKLMNRGYTKGHYLNLVNDYKKITSGKLSTDVIVGFPTETESDFLETKAVLRKIGFATAYIFKYSVRPHTPAADLEDNVPKEEKERRHKELLDMQKEISLSINS